MTQLTFRLRAEERDRLMAVVWHDQQEKAGSPLAPREVNLSERIRELLAEFVELYESQVPGGREGLAELYREARLEELRQQQDSLERL